MGKINDSPVSLWLDTFSIGETRYLEVEGQDEANNLVRQISAKSRRREKTKEWRFMCSTHLALSVTDVTEQQLLLRVTALGPKPQVSL